MSKVAKAVRMSKVAKAVSVKKSKEEQIADAVATVREAERVLKEKEQELGALFDSCAWCSSRCSEGYSLEDIAKGNFFFCAECTATDNKYYRDKKIYFHCYHCVTRTRGTCNSGIHNGTEIRNVEGFEY